MGAITKLLIGAILMAASVWWIVQGSFQLIGRDAVADLVGFVNAAIPLGLFVVGIFVVWLELDEIRIEREIRAEAKRKKKR